MGFANEQFPEAEDSKCYKSSLFPGLRELDQPRIVSTLESIANLQLTHI